MEREFNVELHLMSSASRLAFHLGVVVGVEPRADAVGGTVASVSWTSLTNKSTRGRLGGGGGVVKDSRKPAGCPKQLCGKVKETKTEPAKTHKWFGWQIPDLARPLDESLAVKPTPVPGFQQKCGQNSPFAELTHCTWSLFLFSCLD